MPDINTMKSSRFLKKEDCGAGMLLTIRTCEQMNVAMEGAPEEMKWCLTFEETEKPYVSNVSNRAIIAAFCGRQNTDDWGGVKIVLFNNPSIMYNGKSGGISARAPRVQTKPAGAPIGGGAAKVAVAPAPSATEELDSEIPF